MSEAIEARFGIRVLEFRNTRGGKQEEFGNKLSTSSGVVDPFERGETMPSTEVGQGMAEVFGVTVGYLVGEQQVAKLLSKSDMVERWATLDYLPSEDRNRILYVVDPIIREAKTRHVFTTA